MRRPPGSSTHRPLPIRRVSIETDSAAALVALQPERPRTMVQLRRGEASFRLDEIAWGSAALQRERWSGGVRIRVERSNDFVAYALMTRVEGEARWMGVPFERGAILRAVETWEAVSTGPVEYVAFGVARAALEEATRLLEGPDREDSPREGNRIARSADFDALAPSLVAELRVIAQGRTEPAALRAAEQELVHLAVRLDRPLDPMPVWRRTTPSTRLALVRRVEAHLEAETDMTPTIAKLCAVTGVSERTLEYAFREHLGMTPVRYLKVRRLNRVHRQLQRPEAVEATVTMVALACGFYDLGRFAGEYRALFGELPSETLARSSVARRRAVAPVSAAPRPARAARASEPLRNPS